MSAVSRFEDQISSNFLEFKREGDIIWLERYFVDQDNPKLFVALLQTAISGFIDLKCTKLRQWVNSDDWINFLCNVKYWKIKKLDIPTNTKLLECKIKNAAICIVDSFMANNEEK